MSRCMTCRTWHTHLEHRFLGLDVCLTCLVRLLQARLVAETLGWNPS